MKLSNQSGLSLLEILVTLTIISVLSAVAAPSLQDFIKNNRARAISDDFVTSLYRTRSEAVKRGADVTLCASNATQTNCDASATHFSNGWIVLTDYDSDGLLDPANILFDTTGDGIVDSAEEILYVSGEPSGSFHIQTTVNTLALQGRLTYRSNGLPGTGGRGIGYQISENSTSADATQLSRLVIGMTGRIRSCVGNITKCPAPAGPQCM